MKAKVSRVRRVIKLKHRYSRRSWEHYIGVTNSASRPKQTEKSQERNKVRGRTRRKSSGANRIQPTHDKNDKNQARMGTSIACERNRVQIPESNPESAQPLARSDAGCRNKGECETTAAGKELQSALGTAHRTPVNGEARRGRG